MWSCLFKANKHNVLLPKIFKWIRFERKTTFFFVFHLEFDSLRLDASLKESQMLIDAIELYFDEEFLDMTRELHEKNRPDLCLKNDFLRLHRPNLKRRWKISKNSSFVFHRPTKQKSEFSMIIPASSPKSPFVKFRFANGNCPRIAFDAPFTATDKWSLFFFTAG